MFSQEFMDVLRTVIVGAGTAGVYLKKEIDKMDVKKYTVIGYLDDDEEKQGKEFNGAIVLGKTSQIAEVSKEYDIDYFIIAMPSVDGVFIASLVAKVKEINENQNL